MPHLSNTTHLASFPKVLCNFICPVNDLYNTIHYFSLIYNLNSLKLSFIPLLHTLIPYITASIEFLYATKCLHTSIQHLYSVGTLNKYLYYNPQKFIFGREIILKRVFGWEMILKRVCLGGK